MKILKYDYDDLFTLTKGFEVILNVSPTLKRFGLCVSFLQALQIVDFVISFSFENSDLAET